MTKRIDTFTVYFLDSETQKQFPNKQAAMSAAEKYVGNNKYNKLFPNEDSYIYGPGDGTTSCMVRQDLDFGGS